MKQISIAFLALVIIISGCSVQKRKYQKGFYVSRHKPVMPHDRHEPAKPVIVAKVEAPIVIKHAAELAPDDRTLAAGKAAAPLLIKHKPAFSKADPDTCDEISFRDGNAYRVKVLEINTSEVKYKRCDMLNGPLYVTKKSDIFMLSYANGTKETFAVETNVTNQNPAYNKVSYQKRETHPNAVDVLVLGITGLLFYYGSIHAIIMGARILREMRAEPYRYKGEGMVRAGMALGIIKLALVVALIVFLLLLI